LLDKRWQPFFILGQFYILLADYLTRIYSFEF